MRAVVLVGGEGTRLRPLTYTTPKQMLPVVEHPMIERVVSHLARHGVDRVVLSLGYRPDAFLSAYPDGHVGGVELTYAVEAEPLDTAGAIRFAADQAGIEETFLAVNGDVLTDLDVGGLVGFHHRHRAEATISLTPVEDPSAYGVVPTDSEGRVMAFVEKPSRDEAPTNLINAGTYVLEPSVLELVAPHQRVSIEREVFPGLVERGRLYAQASESYWLDTGTPEKYLQAHRDLLSGRRPGPPAPDAHRIRSDVWVIGEPALDGEVGAASLVGQGARVDRGARVVSSTVGRNAVVHGGARVEDSVILPGADLQRGCVVQGSIVGAGAVIGEGAVVTGLSVIGGGARVGPGEAVAGGRIPGGEPVAEGR